MIDNGVVLWYGRYGRDITMHEGSAMHWETEREKQLCVIGGAAVQPMLDDGSF